MGKRLAPMLVLLVLAALAAGGPLAAGPYREWLRNPSLYVRRQTLDDLAETKDPQAVPDLLAFFSDRRNPVELRNRACEILCAIGGGETLGKLLAEVDELLRQEQGDARPPELDDAPPRGIVSLLDGHLRSQPALQAIRTAASVPFLRSGETFEGYMTSSSLFVRMAGLEAFAAVEGDETNRVARLAPIVEKRIDPLLRIWVWDLLCRHLTPSERWPLFRAGLDDEERVAVALAHSLSVSQDGSLPPLMRQAAAETAPPVAQALRESAERIAFLSPSTWRFIFVATLLLLLAVGWMARRIVAERRLRLEDLDAALRLYAASEFMAALSAFGRHAERWPRHGDRAVLHRALCYLKLGNGEAAEEAALAMRGDRCPIDELYELAGQFEARNLPVPARRYYERVAARDGDHGQVRQRLEHLKRLERGESIDASPILSLRQMATEVIDPRYEKLEFLGKGGMGSVFSGIDARRGLQVAIKILSPQAVEDDDTVRRFYREAIAVSNLIHPQIPKIMDVKKARLPYYVMEFIDGESLKMRLLRDAPLPEAEALAIARDVASALACAHEAGIVHRDVKPGNVILSPERGAVLLDFGIARLGGSTTVTKTGQMIGTPQYMAPEQLKGERVMPSTDVYALSIILYQSLTADFPWNATAPYARLQVDAVPLRAKRPELSPALDLLLRRGLSRDPGERFPDGAALHGALVELEDTLSGRMEKAGAEAPGPVS